MSQQWSRNRPFLPAQDVGQRVLGWPKSKWHWRRVKRGACSLAVRWRIVRLSVSITFQNCLLGSSHFFPLYTGCPTSICWHQATNTERRIQVPGALHTSSLLCPPGCSRRGREIVGLGCAKSRVLAPLYIYIYIVEGFWRQRLDVPQGWGTLGAPRAMNTW